MPAFKRHLPSPTPSTSSNSSPSSNTDVEEEIHARIEEEIQARVREVNSNNPSYAHIPRALVVILPPDAEVPKTSKGSVVRPSMEGILEMRGLFFFTASKRRLCVEC